MLKMLFPLLLPSFLFTSTLGLETYGSTVLITNASDFIELSTNVDSGISYSGSTVLLDDDIDFSGYSDEFNPIGLDPYNGTLFCGSFDGQGHVISNLVVVSERPFVALFGVINGSDFRNVVVDSTCSFTNTHNSAMNFSYTSGVIAYIFTLEKGTMSVVDGCVNMADATFAGGYTVGAVNFAASVGGIVGYILPNNTNFMIRNSVNYGTMKSTGEYNFLALGCVMAAFFDEKFNIKQKCYIKNCANYGNMINTRNMGDMILIGGITSILLNGLIENCINSGKFNSEKETWAVGEIVGLGNQGLEVNNCFWTYENASNVTCGYNYYTEVKVTNTYLVKPGDSTMEALNSWVDENNNNGENVYLQWIMLYMDGGGVNTPEEGIQIVTRNSLVYGHQKEGHEFVCWGTSDDGTCDWSFENASEFYAVWKANNYTLAFDFENWTVIEESVVFNTTIVYPDTRGMKGFHGWNNTLERMPAYDLTIYPNHPQPKSKAGAIAGGVVGSVAFIAIIVIAVIFIVLRRANRGFYARNNIEIELDNSNYYSRVVDRFRGGDDNDSACALANEAGSDVSSYAFLYPGVYTPPTISMALREAGLDKVKAEYAETLCMRAATAAENEGRLEAGITKDDAAAIALYTYDFGPGDFESNPYRILNTALASNNSNDLKRVRGLIFIVTRALRKLPICENITLYRGIRDNVDRDMYKVGHTIVFHGFSSATTDMNVVKEFLASSSEGKGAAPSSSGTLFVLEDTWGYDIQQYSLYPNEREILIEPERHFRVQSVIESNIVVVNLLMLDTPLILENQFNGGSENTGN